MSDVRTFRLMRDIDHTGVSGPGRVADGVVWPDGTVTLRWVGDRPSTVNWAQLADAEYVHGHGGATRFVFDDADTPALASSEQRNGAVGRVQALLKREPGIFSRQEEADFRAVLADRDALAARVAELEAIVAEGDQRSRALALLLIRNGGQVEFTQVEQVTAPQHGELISYPNPATGGLVLAYSADGETIGADPQQTAPAPAEQAAGDGEAEREAVEAAERFAAAWGYGNDVVRETADYTITIGTRDGGEASMSVLQLLAVLDRLRRLERERAEAPDSRNLLMTAYRNGFADALETATYEASKTADRQAREFATNFLAGAAPRDERDGPPERCQWCGVPWSGAKQPSCTCVEPCPAQDCGARDGREAGA